MYRKPIDYVEEITTGLTSYPFFIIFSYSDYIF